MTQQGMLTVIGAGRMGSAVAKAATQAGVPTCIWARRPERRQELARSGLRVAPTASEAFEQGEVILLLLNDYASALGMMSDLSLRPESRVLVNLMTGDRHEALAFQDAIHRDGGLYLDGVIQAYPADVARGHAPISLAGDGAAWEQARPFLEAFTSGASYLGEEVATPNALDAVFSGAFHLVALGAFLEAAAFARAIGIPLSEFGPAARSTAASLAGQIDAMLREMEDGDFETDQATLSVYTAAARKWRAQMTDAGQRAALSAANLQNLEIAVAAGFGEKSIAVQYLTASKLAGRELS